MFYAFELEKYLEELLPPRDELLLEMEEAALAETIPVITPAVGQFLELMIETAGARDILEIGTAIGYSTIYLARGARATGGQVRTIDMNRGRIERAAEYVKRAGYDDIVHFHCANALNYLPELKQSFDFIFVDAAKAEYPEYLDLLAPLVASGGMLVVDNVLFRGWVVPGSSFDSKYKRMVGSVRDFLNRLAHYPGYKVSVLPFGDGLALARRKAD